MAEIVVTGTLKRAIRNVPMSGVVVRAMNTAAFGVGEIAYLIETAPPIKVDSDGTINGAEGFELTVPTVASGDVASYSFGLPRDNETLDTVTLELNDATDPLTLEEAIVGGTPDTGGTINVSGKIYLPFSGLPYPTGFVRVQLVERFVTDDGIFLAVSEDIKIDNGDFNGASGLTLYVPDGQSEWLFTFPDGTAKTAMLGTHTSMVEIADIANGDYATALDPMNVPTSFNAVQVGVDVDLTWTDTNTGETGYRIERSDDSGATWDAVTVTAANATSYTNTSVPAHSYIYRIRAEKSGGQSAWVTDTIAVALATPTGLTLSATGTAFDEIQADWTNNAPGATTEIEYSTDGSSWTPVDETAADGETYTLTTADFDEDSALHYVRVRASLGGNQSGWVSTQLEGGYVYLWARYSMNEAAGNNRANSVDGTVPLAESGGTVPNIAGKIDNAADMSTTGRSLGVTNAIYNFALVPYAFSFWYKWRATAGGGERPFFLQTNSGFGAILLQNDGNLLNFYSTGGTGLIGTITTDQWYHILVGYNGTNYVAYVDNVLGATLADSTVPNGVLLLGAVPTGDGTIDEIHFWRGHFPSAAQRARDYNAGAGRALP